MASWADVVDVKSQTPVIQSSAVKTQTSPKRKRKRNRRRRMRYNYVHSPLRPAATILTEILVDEPPYLLLDFNKLTVGIQTNPQQTSIECVELKEIPFLEFNAKSCKIPVEQVVSLSMTVKHWRSKQDIKLILYDRRSGLDRITNSGNTTSKQMWQKIRGKYLDNIKELHQRIADQQKRDDDAKDDEKKTEDDITVMAQKHVSQNLDKLMRFEYKRIANDTLKILKRGFYKMYYEANGDFLAKKKKEKEDDFYRENSYNRYSNNSRREQDKKHTTERLQNVMKMTKKRRSRQGYFGRGDRDEMEIELGKVAQIELRHKMVNIDAAQQRAVNASILYHHNDEYQFIDERKVEKYASMRIEIRNETTLNAMRDLVADEQVSNPVALNMASPRNPDGMFSGHNDVEETLTRSGGLYAALKRFEKEYHEFHRRHCKSMLYSHSAIYSPKVLFFRDDNGNLLAQPYEFSVISASAVNAKYYIRRHCGPNNEWVHDAKQILAETMRYRIEKILDIAVRHKHDAIVLSAFGCGVNENDANTVADIFATLLATKKYKNAFKVVRFAILEFSNKQRKFDAFHYAMLRRFAAYDLADRMSVFA
eukprot:CAMPEP_0197044096 /NCGR_PEP_ID=MMETSP1384-20130603/20229_1 /TAXON_ID=29189 /ORGANISM="Ammonia sp." /LENGTH=592 /DNA_ID=CAMNT_0042475493 /DNA_START=22 /DNA_END=1800 /DNA_ORIENTATION=+